MKKLALFGLLLIFFSFPVHGDDQKQLLETHKKINALLDGFHQAAAEGDKGRYLGSFTKEGVFMGTDEWERWPLKPDFSRYVGKHFKDGKGWSYQPVERHVNFSEDRSVAWFDEVTVSEKWGRFRGTGVVLKQKGGEWKIAHYALSFLVPNEVWEKTSDLAKKAMEKAREKTLGKEE